MISSDIISLLDLSQTKRTLFLTFSFSPNVHPWYWRARLVGEFVRFNLSLRYA